MKIRKNVLRLGLPLLAAGLLAGCGTSPAERMNRADQAYGENRYAEARLDYTSVLKEEPGNIAVMDKLVRTFLALEDPVAAKGMLDRMASEGYLPKDAPVLYGDVALMEGLFNDALSRVEGMRTAEAYRVAALGHIGNQSPQMAEDAFILGRNAPGSKGRLLSAYAAFKLGIGQLDDARKLAVLAAKEEPVPLSAMLINADIARSDGRKKEALTWFERAQKTFPDSRTALLGRIGILGELDRLEEVRPLVATARKQRPGDPDFIYLEAALKAEDGKWKDVRDILQPIERDLEQLPQSNALYAKAMLELGHGELARARLTSQLLREPHNDDIRLLLAETKLSLGDAAGAIETLGPVADREPVNKRVDELLAEARKASSSGG